MTDDDTTLGAALHDRVRDEHPDLDQLIRVSTRTGTRMRRRRTVAATLGGAFAVAAVVGVVGASLGGGGGRPGVTPGVTPGVATQPSAEASVSLDQLKLIDRREKLTEQARREADELRAQQLPVHVAPSLRGWEIGTAADDKFPAFKGNRFVSVNVRPKSELASWSGNAPDRPASQIVHTGENYFVTVQPGPGAPQAAVDELVDALRYQPHWKN